MIKFDRLPIINKRQSFHSFFQMPNNASSGQIKSHTYSTARPYPQMSKTETNGLISIASKHSVAVTIQRIKRLLVEQGVNVFGVVDHGAAAQKANLELDETQVILFGNPAVGTLLMQDFRPIALELPLKLLVYSEGCITHVQYRLLSSQAVVYGFDPSAPIIQKLDLFIAKIAQSAIDDTI